METAADDIDFDIYSPRDEQKGDFNSLALLADLPRSDVPVIVISDAHSTAKDSQFDFEFSNVVEEESINETENVNENYNRTATDITVDFTHRKTENVHVEHEAQTSLVSKTELSETFEVSDTAISISAPDGTKNVLNSSQSVEFSDVIVKEKEESTENEFTSLKDLDTNPTAQDDLELETDAVNLDSILMKVDPEDDSDSEFDFDLPPQAVSAKAPVTKALDTKAVDTKAVDVTDSTQKAAVKDRNLKEQKSDAVKQKSKTGSPSAEATPKPLGFAKHTPQALGFSFPTEKKEPEKKEVLEAAQDEWSKVTTIQPGYKDAGTTTGTESANVYTMPAISPDELRESLMQQDFTSVKVNIKPSVERRGFAAFISLLFGPPKLTRNLFDERDKVFCIAATQLDNSNSSHIRALQTIYKCLTGSKFDCPRVGSHWEEIGFQGSDPATDLRGVGVLGLLNLLFFLRDPKKQSLASDIYRLSLHPTQNFPFCIMGFNLTKITLQTLREEVLNRECNRRGEIISIVNEFYVGLYLQMYLVWKGQGKTISDSGFVIKDLELKAKKNPKWVLKSLEDYLNRKNVVVAEKGHGLGGDDFVNVCD